MTFDLCNVTFSYASRVAPQQQVFSEFNLTIPSGDFFVITGEEGSGKSTLLQLLNGLQRPIAGKVLVDGKDIWEAEYPLASLRRRIGFAFQFPEQHLFCETVADEVLYTARNLRMPADVGIVKEALARVGLSESLIASSPFALSAGEARRVALASLLPASPDTFLLDEPTAGLDGFGIQSILTLLAELREQRRTIVVVSHHVRSFLHLADRIIVLDRGAIAADLHPRQISENDLNLLS